MWGAILKRIEAKLDHALDLLDALTKQGDKTMASLDALTSQVAQNTSVEQSATILIQGIATQLSQAGTDPTKLSALVTSLNSSATALAAAVTANTPVAAAKHARGVKARLNEAWLILEMSRP